MQYDLGRELLGTVVERLGALADENRLRLLLLLRPGERNVTGLTAEMGLSQASVSKHLGHLRRAGFVDARRDGAAVFYRIGDESVFEVLRIVWDGAIRRLRHEQEALELAIGRSGALVKRRGRERTPSGGDSRARRGRKRGL